MAYAGIDYSLGQSNRDPKTGIHYGVISQHSVNYDCLDGVDYDYGEPHCPECGGDVVPSDDDSLPEDAEWNDGKDFACAECESCYWSDSVYPDEALGWSLDDGEYKLTDCLDSDIFVLASPYYTFAQYCSPCVPGAGNLDTPCEDGPKTFALGHDWFEGGKAPYILYRVSDDSEVLPEES